MPNFERLVEKIRETISNHGIREVTASADFEVEANVNLFPGSVYGFAAALSQAEARILFDEAKRRGLSNLAKLEEFRPICSNLYPIYWGKDKQLGARPYQHLRDPRGTGAIRLSSYEALRGKKLSCAVIIVNDFDLAELALQKRFPHLFKTTMRQQGPRGVRK